MKHYTTAVKCPKCGHPFVVCVHAVLRKEVDTAFVVMCPANGSRIPIAVAELMPADTCPPGALIVRDNRL